MNIVTSHDVGETVQVTIDGSPADCIITEVRVLSSSLTGNIPVVSYQGIATITLRKPDGSEFETEREWIGNDNDIKG